MKVLFYGRLADAICRDVEFAAAPGSIAELRDRISKAHPGAADSLAKSRAVINGTIAAEHHRLAAGETIEFLPPVSGG